MSKQGASVVLTIELWGSDEQELMDELAAFMRMAAADRHMMSRLLRKKRAGLQFDHMRVDEGHVKMEPKVKLEARIKGGG